MTERSPSASLHRRSGVETRTDADVATRALTVLDLFSGIGGFSLGLERTGGFRTIAFCEIDAFCRRVLAKHWPEVPCYDDVRELTATTLAADGLVRPDVICGGFPCQDISHAGKGAGIDGERSGLWREYARLVGELRPDYVIVENVSALRSRGLDRVLGDLAALGYDAEWHCIPASAVGAPHRRDRIWIVAYANAAGLMADAGRGGHEQVTGSVHQVPRRGAPALGHEDTLAERRGTHVADTIGTGLEGRARFAEHLAAELAAVERGGAVLADTEGAGWGEGRRVIDGMHHSPRGGRPGEFGGSRDDSAGRRLAQSDLGGMADGISAGLHGTVAANWLAEPDIPRVAHGVKDRVGRLRALGNSVVPQIPELIGRAILRCEHQPPPPESRDDAASQQPQAAP